MYPLCFPAIYSLTMHEQVWMSVLQQMHVLYLCGTILLFFTSNLRKEHFTLQLSDCMRTTYGVHRKRNIAYIDIGFSTADFKMCCLTWNVGKRNTKQIFSGQLGLHRILTINSQKSLWNNERNCVRVSQRSCWFKSKLCRVRWMNCFFSPWQPNYWMTVFPHYL